MIENIFQTFVFSKTLKNINNQKIRKYSYDLQSKSKANNRSNYGGWQSKPIPDIEKNYPELNKLEKIIAKNVNELLPAFGFKSHLHLEVSAMWININPRGSFNNPHTHPYSVFSGVYYVDVNKESGQIILMNPTKEIGYYLKDNLIEQHTPFTASSYYLVPKNSKLVIFPSWLPHYVEPNLSDHNRLSVSFNTRIKNKSLG